MMGWYGDAGWMMGSWWWMVAFWGVLAALLVLGLGTLVHALGGPRPSTPLDLLQRRYAAGEVSDAEYEQARRRLA